MDCVPLPADNVTTPDRPMVITRTVMKINVEYHDALNPVF
jgi:hypothetical protein